MLGKGLSANPILTSFLLKTLFLDAKIPSLDLWKRSRCYAFSAPFFLYIS